ncbi:YjbH domain-containing protein [Spirosoma fluminis]
MGSPIRSRAQMNISGKPGLMYIPSAEVLEDGTFSIGYNYNPKHYAFRFNKKNSESIGYVNLSLLPRLEVNINLLNPNGPIRFQDKGIGDRQIDLKYALFTEKAKRPSMAVILSAPFGIDNSLVTYALVATKHVALSKAVTAGITAGMGSPYSIYRAGVKNEENSDIFSGYTLRDKRDRPYHYLSGPFGGVNLNFARKGGVMVEWDSQHLNVGAYALLFKHWTVQAGLLNADQITFGTSYSVSLLRSLKPANRLGMSAQEPEPIAQKRDVLLDFENLSVDSAQHSVSFEQRLYRNPMVGLRKLAELVSAKGINEFTPLYQGVPIARYRLSSQLSTSLLAKAERRAWAKAHRFDSRTYKFDFRLQPEFMAQFGFREQTVESKTNLLLQSQLFLNRGLVLNWGVLLPIVNKLDNQDLNVRPAPTFLNQFLALGGANFMGLSAGLFYNDQYGLNVQYRHADLTKNWSFGVETGLTGFYFFPANGLYYEAPDQLLLLADAAYRIPRRDITVKLSGGQYMYHDRGVRLDLIRQLGNVEVGFYALKTSNGGTGGFNFAIPIAPGRIVQTQRFRVRSTEEFRWEYNYSRGYRIGTRYRTGNQLDALLRQYHNSYLQNQYR